MKNLFFIAALFVSLYATAQPPCKGTTKAGQPCKSIIVNKETGYCNAHNPNRLKCEAKNSKGEQCGMPPIKGEHLCRVHNVKGRPAAH
jgi:hypothetical protein